MIIIYSVASSSNDMKVPALKELSRYRNTHCVGDQYAKERELRTPSCDLKALVLGLSLISCDQKSPWKLYYEFMICQKYRSGYFKMSFSQWKMLNHVDMLNCEKRQITPGGGGGCLNLNFRLNFPYRFTRNFTTTDKKKIQNCLLS